MGGIKKKSDLDLEDEFREDMRDALVGTAEERSVEEALQQALDNTTPEEPGEPNKKERRRRTRSEWI
jgi:hypothetical protein